MTRPTLNLMVVAALVAAAVVAGARLPPTARFVAAALGGLGLAACYFIGRHYFVARALMRQHRWDEAALELAAFELEQTQIAWRRALAFLFVGIYTSDGVAIARNNLGIVRLEQRQLDEAEGHFRRALERDERYAVPYANLAIIAALRGDAAAAAEAAQRAKSLGFRRRGFHQSVRTLLARTNEALGSRRD